MMDGVIIGWAGIGLVVLGNVAALFYWGGRTTTRLSHLENLMNDHLKEHRKVRDA